MIILCKEKIQSLGVALIFPLSLGILHVNNLLKAWLYPDSDDYCFSHPVLWALILMNMLFFFCMLGFAKYSKQQALFQLLCHSMMFSVWTAIFIKYFSDALWIIFYLEHHGLIDHLSQTWQGYLGVEKWIYACMTAFALGFQLLSETSSVSFLEKKTVPAGLFMLSFLFPVAFLISPVLGSLYLFSTDDTQNFKDISANFKGQLNIFYSLAFSVLMTVSLHAKSKNRMALSTLIYFFKVNVAFMALSIIFQILAAILPFFKLSSGSVMDKFTLAFDHVKTNGFALTPTVFMFLIALLAKKYYQKKLLDESVTANPTTGKFGTAAWMSEKELYEKGSYDPATGPVIGTDAQGRPLYFPLLNTLILGPPGSGKSLKYMSALLLEDRASFILDIKGELLAVTARHRAQAMGRAVIAIDPYGISRQQDFIKSPFLTGDYAINPFDYLPEEETERDRMLTAFADSFIISDAYVGGASRHFEENAKILIRGYMDYMMKTMQEKKERILNKLYKIMCESRESSDNTFKRMQLAGGYAAAAANQILRVGSHERGSILSTAYRQIDWIGDSNIQRVLSQSNFNLGEFLKGNMDIYVLLPNEQVREKSRLIRMLLALIKSLVTQAVPSQLPAKKMLFILDELAQFGYCQDVEQFIEVMRSYKAVIWPAFQSMDQITKVYKKTDLFLGMPLKTIFTIDDLDTMRWIQSSMGKTTVNTKSFSITAGDSRQKMQVYGGNVSKSETENIHETGIDLIPLNEIREWPFDEQLILWTGNKPLKCKKIIYYKHPLFKGKFDENPFEK